MTRKRNRCSLLLGFAVVFIVGIGACGHQPLHAQDVVAIKQKYGKSIFRIGVQISNEAGVALPEQFGTGFMVSTDGHILTAAHVLFSDSESPGQRVTRRIYAHTRDYSAGRISVDVVGAPDRDLDLALLRLSIVSTEAVPCWNADVRIVEGSPLLGLGYPGSEPMIPAAGFLANKLGGQGRWLATLPAGRGHSGAPIFDARGGVIGIIRGGHISLSQLIEFVPENYVRGFLSRFGITPPVCSPPPPPPTPPPYREPAPPAMEAVTCWDHNGSKMKLLANGTNRRMAYLEVREGMREYVNPGELVFDGSQVGDQWSGVAYVFIRGHRCAKMGYAVAGRSQGAGAFVLKGRAPLGASANCDPSGSRDDTLVFTRLSSC